MTRVCCCAGIELLWDAVNLPLHECQFFMYLRLSNCPMPKPNPTPAQTSDQTWRRINQFATRSFRDMADGDYIAARLAFRAGLMPQGLWSAQQAFEKYLKYILLVNRIPARDVKHDIGLALRLLDGVTPKVELSEKARIFFDHVAQYGENRYFDISYFVDGYVLLDLDRVVWDLRRYCQILNVFGKSLPADEQQRINLAQEQLKDATGVLPGKFRLSGGWLEKVLDDKNHRSRSALVWQNPFFGSRARATFRVQDISEFSNASLWLYPDMLEELLEYVRIPGHLVTGYREHFKKITANPALRP